MEDTKQKYEYKVVTGDNASDFMTVLNELSSEDWEPTTFDAYPLNWRSETSGEMTQMIWTQMIWGGKMMLSALLRRPKREETSLYVGLTDNGKEISAVGYQRFKYPDLDVFTDSEIKESLAKLLIRNGPIAFECHALKGFFAHVKFDPTASELGELSEEDAQRIWQILNALKLT